MQPKTIQALAALPPAPFTVGETETDYSQADEPRATRAIRDKRGIDLVYLVATTMLVCEGEPLEENNPARIQSANAVAAAWAKSPELIAALSGLLEFVEVVRISGQFPAGGTPMPLSYARRVLEETEAAILNANPTEDASQA